MEITARYSKLYEITHKMPKLKSNHDIPPVSKKYGFTVDHTDNGKAYSLPFPRNDGKIDSLDGEKVLNFLKYLSYENRSNIKSISEKSKKCRYGGVL